MNPFFSQDVSFFNRNARFYYAWFAMIGLSQNFTFRIGESEIRICRIQVIRANVLYLFSRENLVLNIKFKKAASKISSNGAEEFVLCLFGFFRGLFNLIFSKVEAG